MRLRCGGSLFRQKRLVKKITYNPYVCSEIDVAIDLSTVQEQDVDDPWKGCSSSHHGARIKRPSSSHWREGGRNWRREAGKGGLWGAQGALSERGCWKETHKRQTQSQGQMRKYALGR